MARAEKNYKVQKPKSKKNTIRSSRRFKEQNQKRTEGENNKFEARVTEETSNLVQQVANASKKIKIEVEEETDEEDENPINEKIMASIDYDIHNIDLTSKYLIRLIHQKIKLNKNYTIGKKYGFYNYRKWKAEWKSSYSSTDSIIKFMFGVTNNIPYYREIFPLILNKVILAMENDRPLIIKFFKFYMSLPIFEYEYSFENSDMSKLPSFKHPTPLGEYGKMMGNFSYKPVEINDKDCEETIDKITEKLNLPAVNSLRANLRSCQKIKDLNEDELLINSRELLIEPLCRLLLGILKESCELTFEKKRIHDKLTSGNIKYTDSACYLKGTHRILCCYEFKQFPMKLDYYYEDGTFNLSKLFGEECENDIGKNTEPLQNYAKQLFLEMMSHRIDRGVLSNSYTFILVIIDLDRFENDIKDKLEEGADFKARDFPIKYKIVNYHSGDLTAREHLLSFNYHSFRTEEELEEIRKRMEILERYYKLTGPNYEGRLIRMKKNEEDKKKRKNDSKDKTINYYPVTSASQQIDLNDLYSDEYDELVQLSENVFLEDALNEEYIQKEEYPHLDEHSSQMSSSQPSKIFSSAPASSLPSSQTTSSNSEKGKNKDIKNIQMSYCFKLCKQGFKMHKTICSSSKDVELLQGSDFAMSYVYVIESKHVLNYINESVNSEKVVVKIHNPFTLSFLYENVSWPNNIVNCVVDEDASEKTLQLKGSLKNYLTELECYKKLNKNPEFNSIGYDHKNINLLLIVDGFGKGTGFTNIFKYIENQPLPKNLATFKKTRKQLEIIHEAGFIHNDIAERNILYSKDEKVYIIDFSSASYEPDNEVAKKRDMHDLEFIFK